MRKIAILLVPVLVLLLLAGCGGGKPDETTTSIAATTEMTTQETSTQESAEAAKLRALLEEEIDSPILAFEYDDFDGDGTCEAFAFVGEEQNPAAEDEGYKGEIWFVGADGARKAEKSPNDYYWGLIDTINFGGYKFAVVTTFGQTGGLVNVWGVRDGKPYREGISGHGYRLEPIDGKNLKLWHTTLDAGRDREFGLISGRTDKPYWFFWDEASESFKEYGGLRIAEKQLRRCEGAAQVLDDIDAQDKLISDIFYRGNGIINVNCFTSDPYGEDYSYVTLLLDGTKVTVIGEDEYNDGKYLAALAPEIAVYPELPEFLADYSIAS